MDINCTQQKNKKVAGKFKDECGVKNSDGAPYYSPISEFVSLRPKMYSYVKADGKEDRRVKGISRPVVKHDIRHEMFMECLLGGVEKNTSRCKSEAIIIISVFIKVQK